MKAQLYKVRLEKAGRVEVVSDSARHPAASLRLFRELLGGLPHEEIWILVLNARLTVHGAIRVSMGGLHGAAVRPVDVLRPVVASGAHQFVMAHNHPSGDATPSAEDLTMTRRILRAASVVGLTLLDHLIVTEAGDWTSLAETTDLWTEKECKWCNE